LSVASDGTGAGHAPTQIIGREPELAVVRRFLNADPSIGALLLTGGPGIGKTTILDAAIEEAGVRDRRVLRARPADVEVHLAFAVLADLFDDLERPALEDLPSPQRRALEVALLRAEPSGDPPEPRAIALGLLNTLRALAADQPLLIAIDDVQLTDLESAQALAFAVRRLAGVPVRFLLSRRTGRSSVVERALPRSGLERMEVGPLSLGACRRLLFDRLGLSLPRPTMRRMVESARGNPLFVLELGRAVILSGSTASPTEIPIPDEIEDLLGTRVDELPERVRSVLLAVSLTGGLAQAELEAMAEPGAMEEALEAGVIASDRGNVSVSHPLLAAAARKRSRASERRALHLALSDVVSDEEQRARHAALATRGVDARVAEMAAAAGARAAARGAPRAAVELADHALRLTHPQAAERADRVLDLAEHLNVAGEDQRMTELLTAELERLPPGAARARAHLLLTDGVLSSLEEHADHLERALAESADDPVLHAWAVEAKVEYAVVRVEQIEEAEGWASSALAAAKRAGPAAERLVLFALGWSRILRGVPIDRLRDRYEALSDPGSEILRSLDRLAGIRLAWRGHVIDARALFGRLLESADERGEVWSYDTIRLQLCELELRAGQTSSTSRLLEEWEQSAGEDVFLQTASQRCRALLAATRGSPSEVGRWATGAIAAAEATGMIWDMLEATRAQGIAALFAHDTARAAEHLLVVWDHTRRAGVEEPGAFPVAADLVESLVDLGRIEEARAVIDRLSELAERQRHPWGRATARRCGALVRLASGHYGEDVVATMSDAAAEYRRLGLGFDAARSMLALGRAARRSKKWAAARRALEESVATFEQIDSPGWADQARSELGRVGARRPRATGELTTAERRAAELAARGLSNKEVARSMFVGVHTVESHLSSVYAKLGIRSRTQLAGHLPPPDLKD
jgi:DNA-binding CsgD family transcriptional regulator